MCLDQAASAAAQPGSLLEAHFSIAGKNTEGSCNDGQQQSKGSAAAAVEPTQQEAPQPKEATAASKQGDSAAGARMSLRDRIRMLKGNGAS